MIGNVGVGGEEKTIRIGTTGTHTTTHLAGAVQIDGSLNVNGSAVLTAATSRFEACADGVTVADHDTGLLWERKTGTFDPGFPDPGFPDSGSCETVPGGCPDPHDVNNRYAWSVTGTAADGNAYTDFLARLNGLLDPTAATGCFANRCDWRLPEISELQTILVGPKAAPAQAGTCSVVPCIDPAFAALGGPTASLGYWSASTSSITTVPDRAWVAYFNDGLVNDNGKTGDSAVRAVGTGSCTQ